MNGLDSTHSTKLLTCEAYVVADIVLMHCVLNARVQLDLVAASWSHTNQSNTIPENKEILCSAQTMPDVGIHTENNGD